MERAHHDVAIVGAGLAGLTLAYQLLRETDKTIVLLERRPRVPGPRQKVGEATVQVSGYYLSKVLDLEEHLLHDHLMKYNLRFYWKTPGAKNDSIEDYSQSFIRGFSNVASYQLDRNILEAELFRRVGADPRCTAILSARELAVELSRDGAHRIDLAVDGQPRALTADWVVDTTGRNRLLARRLGLRRKSPIRHGSFFFWVDGTVNVEKLTGLTPRARRLKRERAALGHLPMWLATNHFAGEGYWFWVIPLRGKTSLGLVYDQGAVGAERFASAEQTRDWVCETFPALARDLPARRILDFGALTDYAHGCASTISDERWALSGEAGRFLDPLYSPGGDLIAIHNTLITDAIRAAKADLPARCRDYELLMRAFYEAFVPGFAIGYETLGCPEVFSLKYSWELSIYFAFYVFPFLNDLFTEPRFLPSFLRHFAQLGKLNHGLQELLRDFYRWKKGACAPLANPVLYDFGALGPLAAAERTFYRIGLTVEEARDELARQSENLKLLARYLVAYVCSRVVGDATLLERRSFVEAIDLEALRFDPDEIARRWASSPPGEPYRFPFDASVLDRFRTPHLVRPAAAATR